MHTHNLSNWSHDHVFDTGNQAAERGTRLVMWITAAMMVIEIFAGWWYNSMALLADGWHMSSHAVAIGLSAFAYSAARKYARDTRFAFGTWKIEVLGGFASAIFLLGVAVCFFGRKRFRGLAAGTEVEQALGVALDDENGDERRLVGRDLMVIVGRCLIVGVGCRLDRRLALSPDPSPARGRGEGLGDGFGWEEGDGRQRQRCPVEVGQSGVAGFEAERPGGFVQGG